MSSNKNTVKRRSRKTSKGKTIKSNPKSRRHRYVARGGLWNTFNSGLSGATTFLRNKAQSQSIPGQPQPPHVQMFGHLANGIGQLQAHINTPEFQNRVGNVGNQLNQHLQLAKQSANNIYQGAQNGQFGQDVQQHMNTFNGAIGNVQNVLKDKNLGAAGKNISNIAKSTANAGNLALNGKMTKYQMAKFVAGNTANMGQLGWNTGRMGVRALSAVNNMNRQPQKGRPQYSQASKYIPPDTGSFMEKNMISSGLQSFGY